MSQCRTIHVSREEMRALAAAMWPGAKFSHLQDDYVPGAISPGDLEVLAPNENRIVLRFTMTCPVGAEKA